MKTRQTGLTFLFFFYSYYSNVCEAPQPLLLSEQLDVCSLIFNVSIVFTLVVILSCIEFVVEKIEKSNLNTEASRSVLFPQMW